MFMLSVASHVVVKHFIVALSVYMYLDLLGISGWENNSVGHNKAMYAVADVFFYITSSPAICSHASE